MPPNLKSLHYLRLKWALVPILFIKFQIITPLKSAFFSVHHYLSLPNLPFVKAAILPSQSDPIVQ